MFWATIATNHILEASLNTMTSGPMEYANAVLTVANVASLTGVIGASCVLCTKKRASRVVVRGVATRCRYSELSCEVITE